MQFWGIPYGTEGLRHENLNGKHLKDWFGTTRSFIFPDGCKITYAISSIDKRTVSISIHDTDESHYFNGRCDASVEKGNTLIYSSTDKSIGKLIDEALPDGETGTLRDTGTGVLFLNIYTEEEAGKKTEKELPLGQTVHDEPKRVDDLYDDARLGHT